MKTRIFKHMATAATLVVTVGLTSMAPAQQPGSVYLQSVEPLTPTTESFTLGRMLGKPVRNTNHEDLTTIADFLVEPRSGRVHFAVVPAGSSTFRLIPMRALQPGSGNEQLIVQRQRREWDQIGTLTADQLQNTVFIDNDHQQRLARQFALGDVEPAVQGLIRVSSLRGREVRSPSELFGRVDDVVIDFHNKIAAPVVRMFGPAQNQRYLISMTRLSMVEGQSAIATTLTRNDFQPTAGQPLSPTGYDSRSFGPNASPSQSAISAVQQALDRDSSLPRGSIFVVPESRLVLRGYVESEQKKAAAQQAAQQAAPGVSIDNQIMVRTW